MGFCCSNYLAIIEKVVSKVLIVILLTWLYIFDSERRIFQPITEFVEVCNEVKATYSLFLFTYCEVVTISLIVFVYRPCKIQHKLVGLVSSCKQLLYFFNLVFVFKLLNHVSSSVMTSFLIHIELEVIGTLDVSYDEPGKLVRPSFSGVLTQVEVVPIFTIVRLMSIILS